jgi:hypothetical protein
MILRVVCISDSNVSLHISVRLIDVIIADRCHKHFRPQLKSFHLQNVKPSNHNQCLVSSDDILIANHVSDTFKGYAIWPSVFSMNRV